MYYLYAYKKTNDPQLVATFDSEAQLKAYVGWATLKSHGERTGKFEQGSVLSSFTSWDFSAEPLTEDDPENVTHNPSPTML